MEKPSVHSGFSATQLLGSLKVRPFCDSSDTKGLTPEQQAALHAFLHEVVASYYRMTSIVPEDQAMGVLNKRFAKVGTHKPLSGG